MSTRLRCNLTTAVDGTADVGAAERHKTGRRNRMSFVDFSRLGETKRVNVIARILVRINIDRYLFGGFA